MVGQGDSTAWHRLGRTALNLLGSRAVFGLVNLAAAAVAVRAVGLEGFGAVVLCHAVARLVGETLRFQSWQAILGYGTPMMDRGEGLALGRLLRTTVTLDAVALALPLAALLLLAPTLGAALGWPAPMQDWVQVYALSAIFMTSATPTGVLRLIDRFDILIWQHALNALIRLGGALAVLALGLGVDAMFAVWFGAAVLSGGWMMMRAFTLGRGMLSTLSAGPAAARPDEAGSMPPGFWRFVLSTNLASSVSAAILHGTTLAVGAVLGPAATALYAIARQISDALAKPVKLLGPVMLPAFTETRSTSAEDALGLLYRALGIGALAMVAIVAVTTLAGDAVLVAVFGEEALAVHGLLVLAAAAAAVTLWGFALEPVILAAGRADLSLILALGAAATYALLLAWLLPTEGLSGAGIALLAHAALLFTGRLAVARWVMRNRVPPKYLETA